MLHSVRIVLLEIIVLMDQRVSLVPPLYPAPPVHIPPTLGLATSLTVETAQLGSLVLK